MKIVEKKVKRIEAVFYAPTTTKGDRIRLLGLSNKFIPYNYECSDALEMGLSLLGGYDIVDVIPTDRGGIIFIEEPIYGLEDGEIDIDSL